MTAFGGAVGQRVCTFERRTGRAHVAAARQQFAPYGVEQVVGVEIVEPVEQRQPGARAVGHRSPSRATPTVVTVRTTYSPISFRVVADVRAVVFDFGGVLITPVTEKVGDTGSLPEGFQAHTDSDDPL